MVKPSVQKTGSKSAHEPCSSDDKGPIYEEQRLRVDELDEWRTHKPRTHDKPKSSHDELNISQKQLNVGDKVLLDTADPRIATSEPNGEIPLTVLSIFPYGTVEVIHPKFSTFKVNNTRLKPYLEETDSRDDEFIKSSKVGKGSPHCHVLPDYHDNFFAGHYGCGTNLYHHRSILLHSYQGTWPIILHNSISRNPFII
ncbi:hypothetical protein GOBAR_AA21404 [Gossypium barbadense]|uniref:Uncharacterized protein n=1 Tax=Gossypium barbadense TaxID=3634 RepID=A0A2P5X7G3_GOSBA|nr:hypothetical protein GOBAR_AA21404 [Gossypium barbadense]